MSEFKVRSDYSGEWTGSGTYWRGPDSQAEMVLDLETVGGTTTRFSGKVLSAGLFPWPVIVIGLANPPEYFGQGFSLLAAPSTDYLEFQLGPGSEISFGCQGCEPPFGAYAVAGTFRIGRIDGDASSSLYRIDTMEFRTTGEIDWEFDGHGLLSVADGNIQENSKISLGGTAFNHGMDFLFQSESGVIGDPSGGIEVTMVQRSPTAPAELLSRLRLVAAPSTAAPFLRGDPNADGAVDISDAIGILSRLFLGAAHPGCEEAADVNADGKHDPSDAIALLAYLFQDGAPPPFPGTRRCGLPRC
jgi:hypothetical protein